MKFTDAKNEKIEANIYLFRLYCFREFTTQFSSLFVEVLLQNQKMKSKAHAQLLFKFVSYAASQKKQYFKETVFFPPLPPPTLSVSRVKLIIFIIMRALPFAKRSLVVH